jgi:hypothetical protein
MDWFEGSLEDAAVEWRDSVLAARSAELPARYFEIRYEDLLGDPRSNVLELYEFLDLDTSGEAIDAALGEARKELNADPRSNVGREKWRELLTPEQQATILSIAGDALAAYGYVDEEELAAAPGGAPSGGGLLSRLRRRA